MSRAAFPYAIGPGGQTAAADHRDYVESLIIQVMGVEPGERVNRPAFGCSLRGLVFAGGRSEMTIAVEALVQSALRQWTADVIRIQDVDVTMLAETVQVIVHYVDLGSRTAHRLVVSP